MHGDLEGTVAGPRAIFEAWLYGGTFHQDDPQKKAMHVELRKFGPHFDFGLQLIVLEIVQLILYLGVIVKTALSEEDRQRGSPPSVV